MVKAKEKERTRKEKVRQIWERKAAILYGALFSPCRTSSTSRHWHTRLYGGSLFIGKDKKGKDKKGKDKKGKDKKGKDKKGKGQLE